MIQFGIRVSNKIRLKIQIILCKILFNLKTSVQKMFSGTYFMCL